MITYFFIAPKKNGPKEFFMQIPSEPYLLLTCRNHRGGGDGLRHQRLFSLAYR